MILTSLSQALIHGLGRHYYSMPINYRKNELEQKVSFSRCVCVCVCGYNDHMCVGVFRHYMLCPRIVVYLQYGVV